MRIRDAEERDLPEIVEIVNAFLPTTTIEWTDTLHTLESRRVWLREHREAGDVVLVADAGDELAGFANYGDFRDSRKWPGYRFTVEHTIHVRERHWHSGVGSLLLQELMKRAAAAGKRIMVGGIDGENISSIRFHERHGFVEVARMPGIGWKLGRSLSLVLMQRELTATPRS